MTNGKDKEGIKPVFVRSYVILSCNLTYVFSSKERDNLT